jgi:alpha-glucuronidase
MPRYYHKAGPDGIGFDRTRSGSDAVDQYNEPLASLYNDPATCPEELLLWFHHLPWDYRMPSGLTLWEELQAHYNAGVEAVERYVEVWAGMKPYVTASRHAEVASLLESNLAFARSWRDECLEYFGQFIEEQ